MPRDGDSRHILIVEDDNNTAEMLSSYFSSVGYQVSHAAWGRDALKIATETLPDLIVLDIHLPDIGPVPIPLTWSTASKRPSNCSPVSAGPPRARR